MYPMYFYSRAMQPDELVKQVTLALNGEFSAIKCYESLAKLAPNEEEREQILEIRQDEIRHFKELVKLYTALTGRDPSPTMTEECPTDYEKGLEAAFKDEQNTVDQYLKNSDNTNNLAAKKFFSRAARDEQHHAVWFLFYLNRKR